jgi:hypothetical protein
MRCCRWVGCPPEAPVGSALTCYAAGGTVVHVYYFDRGYNVNELAWDGNTNRWACNRIGTQPQTAAPTATAGSGLTCWDDNGKAHVYYVTGDPDPSKSRPLNVIELQWADPNNNNNWHWVSTPIGKNATPSVANAGSAPEAAAGSGLTCWDDNGKAHVYYVTGDPDPSKSRPLNVIELRWADSNNNNNWHWVWTPIGKNATPSAPNVGGAPPAAAGSALTCWDDNSKAHVYYLDETNEVIELQWADPDHNNNWRWVWNPIGKNATPSAPNVGSAPQAVAGSGLTCYDDNGKAHVYYLDQTNNVIELQWADPNNNNNWYWVWTPIGKNATPSVANAGSTRQAAAGSGLTCYDDNGKAHVYYESPSPDQRIHQLMWTGSGWVDSAP